jgi:hypothetical protein
MISFSSFLSLACSFYSGARIGCRLGRTIIGLILGNSVLCRGGGGVTRAELRGKLPLAVPGFPAAFGGKGLRGWRTTFRLARAS